MEISIFEVLGPVMIGPSSSHTAGAARLASVAAQIAAEPFERIRFGLSGSFAQTCRGHGTDKALLAGALGLAPDDERIPDAEALARGRGIRWEFVREDLDWMHENSAHLTFFHPGGGQSDIWGSSVGGGRIVISRVGEFDIRYFAENPALMVAHLDRPGVISAVSGVLARHGVNIAVLRLSRTGRGGAANAMFMVDGAIPAVVAEEVRALPFVEEVVNIDVS